MLTASMLVDALWNAPVGIALLDQDLRFLQVNEALARMDGLAAAAHVGRRVQEVLAGDDPVMAESIRRVRAGEVTLAVEVTLPGPLSGEAPRTWRVSWFPLRIEGSTACFGLMLVDITAQKRAEAAAQTSQRLLQSTLENFPTVIAFKDREGRFIDVNHAVEQALGLPKEKIVGRTVYDFVAKEAADVLTQHDREVMESRRARRFEEVTPLASGVLHHVNTNFPLVDGAGHVYGTGHISHDLTEMKRVEAALRESERQFRALVDNLPDLAWSAQPDGNIDFYNRRWYEYTGTTPEEMAGWGWKSVHDPRYLPEVVERWTRSLASGEPFEMEFPLRRADGVYRWFLTRIRPLADSTGKIVRWFGANTDVDEVTRAIELREEFLSIAAHELRTPLTTLQLQIQGALRMLARGENQKGAVASMLEMSIQQTHRLTRLVNTLLEVSPIAKGTLRLQLEQVDLVALVSDVLRRMADFARRTESAIVFEPEGAVSCTCDRLRIDQVVTNLLENALKYGAGKPVEVAVRSDGDRAQITVADQGIGIAPHDAARIFGPFERAVPSRNYGGLGLGLYISRQILEAHGGGIEVASEAGKGATFTVTLPVRRVARASDTIG